MRKIVTVILCLLLVVSAFAGCGTKNEQKTSTETAEMTINEFVEETKKEEYAISFLSCGFEISGVEENLVYTNVTKEFTFAADKEDFEITIKEISEDDSETVKSIYKEGNRIYFPIENSGLADFIGLRDENGTLCDSFYIEIKELPEFLKNKIDEVKENGRESSIAEVLFPETFGILKEIIENAEYDEKGKYPKIELSEEMITASEQAIKNDIEKIISFFTEHREELKEYFKGFFAEEGTGWFVENIVLSENLKLLFDKMIEYSESFYVKFREKFDCFKEGCMNFTEEGISFSSENIGENGQNRISKLFEAKIQPVESVESCKYENSIDILNAFSGIFNIFSYQR